MTFLVTGAGGQLGRCFQEIQEANPDRDYRFFTHEELDITSEEDFFRLEASEFRGVINCAAYTHVDKAERDHENAYAVNVRGPELLAKWCRENHLFLIHISTDYVYGKADHPIKEDHRIDPINYYGVTKWKGEEVIRDNLPSHLIVRTSWLYSQHGHNFVRTMLRLGKERDLIRVVDDQVGSPTYAADLADALDEILHRLGDVDQILFGTYNFSNNGAVSWFEFAESILKNRPSVIVHPIPSDQYPVAAQRSAYSVLDTSLFSETFGIEIRDWQKSLQQCLKIIEQKGE